MEQILNQPLANVSYCDFEDLFISFCIKHQLFNVTFPCFQNSDFSSDRIDSLCHLSLSNQDEQDWFKLWLTLKQLDGNLSDEFTVYQAVIGTNHFLSKGNTDLYLQKHPLVVLATVMYGNKMLKDVVENRIPADFPISSDTLHSTIKHLPLLKMALSSQLSDYNSQPDVTVYQLLQGCSPLDVSKLFGWQSMHMCVTRRQEFVLFFLNSVGLWRWHFVKMTEFLDIIHCFSLIKSFD